MALIPSIANYFGVSIDELFGYKNDRDRKIDAIIKEIDAFHIKSRGDDEWVDECLGILRLGLAEFPQNEKLRITLADTLSEAGWRRHHEWLYYDETRKSAGSIVRRERTFFYRFPCDICKMQNRLLRRYCKNIAGGLAHVVQSGLQPGGERNQGRSMVGRVGEKVRGIAANYTL